jgi:hypothetical protein
MATPRSDYPFRGAFSPAASHFWKHSAKQVRARLILHPRYTEDELFQDFRSVQGRGCDLQPVRVRL